MHKDKQHLLPNAFLTVPQAPVKKPVAAQSKKKVEKEKEKKIERPCFDLPEDFLFCRDTTRDDVTPPPQTLDMPLVHDGLSSSQSSSSRSADSFAVRLTPDSKHMLRGMNINLFEFI